MTHMQYIRSEMEKASSLLATASDLMKHGRLVSIVSLKRMVDSICTAIHDAGYAECLSIKPMMAELFQQIEAFSEEMHEHYGFLKTAAIESDS